MCGLLSVVENPLLLLLGNKQMQCNATKLELDLMPDHSVIITLRCDTAYEAAVLFEDLNEGAKTGSLHLDFVVKRTRVEIDRTGSR